MIVFRNEAIKRSHKLLNPGYANTSKCCLRKYFATPGYSVCLNLRAKGDGIVRNRRSKSGFSLLEVMLAVTFVGVVMTAVVVLQINSTRSINKWARHFDRIMA